MKKVLMSLAFVSFTSIALAVPKIETWPPPGSPDYMAKTVENPEINELLRKKKYDEILKMQKETPEKFDLPQEYTALAISYFTKGDLVNTVKTCAKSMKFRDYRSKNKCGRLAGQVKKRNDALYRLSLAEFYVEDKDYPSALIKYYRLLEDGLQVEKVRMGIVRIFRENKMPEYVLDQFRQLTDEKNKTEVEKYLKERANAFHQAYRRMKLEELPRQHQRIYRMLILKQEAMEKFYVPLVGFYEDKLLQRYEAQTALRIANLYMLKDQYRRVRDVLGQLEFKIAELSDSYTLEDRLAHDALVKRLPQNERTKLAKSSQEMGKALVDDQASGEEKPFAPPIIDYKMFKDYEPFDFSDVEMASNDNMESFAEVNREFQERFNAEQDPYKQRWLFEQVHNKFYELYQHRLFDHNLNPEEIPLGKYYLSAEGGALKKQLEDLEKQYLAEDLMGAKQYKGSLKKLNDELNSSDDIEEHRKVLRRFYLWWDSLHYRERDPFKRGAFRAYMRSPEGIRLIQKARREVNRVNDQLYLTE